MRMVCNEKSTDIAKYHQDVLINCVDVKQIVLHLADDVSENPKVTPEHGGLVHQAKRMGDAFTFLQNLQERGSIYSVISEL